MTKDELLAGLASLSAEEKAAIGIGSYQPPAVGVEKFSVALDRVDEENIPAVVNACRAGIKQAATDGDDGKALEPLAKVSPALADAASRNSRRRYKPNVHSLAVAIQYLQSPQAAAKREAAKRRVPAPAPAPTPAPAPSTEPEETE